MANPFFLASRIDRLQIVVGVVISAAECIVDPGSTIVIGKIFDGVQDVANGRLLGDTFLKKVQTYIYWLIGLTFYSALINSVGYMVWVSLGYTMGHKARSRMYRVFMYKNTSWFDENANLSGTATSHFKDIQDIEVAAGVVTYEIVAMSCGIVAQLVVAFYYSWAVTFVCLAGIPVLVLVGGIFATPINKRILKSKALLDRISEKASWVLSSLKTVKIHQKETTEWASLNEMLVEQKNSSLKFWFLSNLQQGLCRAIVLLIFVQGFYFGSFMVKHKGLKAGSVITVFWSCLNASSQLQLLMTHLVEWSKGSASAERLEKALRVDREQELYNSIGLMPDMGEKMLEKFANYGWSVNHIGGGGIVNKPANVPTISTPVISHPIQPGDFTQLSWGSSVTLDVPKSNTSDYSFDDLKGAPKGHICFSGVVFSYPSRNEIVLSGLDMEILPGSTVFVLGHSGSGKSTLAALLSGQYPWQAGEISIDSHDIHLLSKRWIEDNIYICEQFPKLFEVSINDNVRIGSSDPEGVSDDEVENALSDSCADFVQLLPQKGNTKGTNKLSGGQKQRIALARARLRDAPIMLFDEVTSALDPKLQSKVFARLLSYRAGKTTIIITHDVSIIPEGYPIFHIQNGISKHYVTISELMDDLRKQPASNLKNASRLLQRPFSNEYSRLMIAPTLSRRSRRSTRGSFSSRNSSSSSSSTVGNNKEILCLDPPVVKKPSISSSEFLMVYRTLPKKIYFYLGITISIIHSVINPVFSFIFSKMVMGIFDVNSSKTTMWAMLVLAFAFIDGIISVGKLFLNVAAENWLRSIRSMLMDRVLTAEGFNWNQDLASYYLKMLVSDTEKCSEILTLYWPGIVSMCSLGLVGFIWALSKGWKLTLVGSSILPAFVGINQIYKHMTQSWTKRREGERQQVVQLMMDLTSESGFRTVKVQHLELYFKKKYSAAENSLNNLTTGLVCQVGVGYGTLKCIPYALECLLLWYGMHLIGNGDYTTQQTLTVFSLLMFTIITIDQLTSSIGSIGNGFEALERLMKVIRDLDPAKIDPVTNPIMTPRVNGELPDWRSVAFYGVGIEYEDGTKVLGSFNEKFTSDEFVAIVGPSGVGKSTIANMLVRLQSPTTGEIVIDGEWDLQTMSLYDIRRNISMVGQSPLDFFSGSVKENLLYGLPHEDYPSDEQLFDVCKSCGVHEFVADLADGYDTRIKSGLLSGGQQQRLGIARALVRNPKILILDECTSALDSTSKEIIKDLILKLHHTRSMIIILITHQMDVAEIADRIVQL